MTLESPPENFDVDQVAIVPATEEDQPSVLALFREGLAEGHIRENDTGADVENLREAYLDDDGASGFWIAHYQGQVIGMIGVQKTSDNSAEMRRLRVSEGYRRRGVATRLMEQALAFCKERGYLKVVLDVRYDREPAIRLFEKFGFILARSREINGRRMLDFYVDLYTDPTA